MGSPRDHDSEDDKAGAKGHLVQGIGHLFRAARHAATGIRKEIHKSNATKTIDDAGRELQRAVTNVVRRVGAGIEKVGGAVAAEASARGESPHPRTRVDAGTAWPATRDDYERTYGPVTGDWPRSREEYQRRYGAAPHDPDTKPKGPTPSDPGFSIADDPGRHDPSKPR